MKLLLFSDLHADIDAAQQLVRRAQEVDVVLGAGDFANFHRGLRRSIDILRAIDRPTIFVPGNHETTAELRMACRGWSAAHVLHGAAVTIGQISFFGIGGGIPTTPFGSWSFDFSEEEAAVLFDECPTGCVLVSHSPPKGVVDVSSRGLSLGSFAVRDAIRRLTPRLVVCGHIHECWEEVDYIGSTPVVNAGPRGMQWVLETPV